MTVIGILYSTLVRGGLVTSLCCHMNGLVKFQSHDTTRKLLDHSSPEHIQYHHLLYQQHKGKLFPCLPSPPKNQNSCIYHKPQYPASKLSHLDHRHNCLPSLKTEVTKGQMPSNPNPNPKATSASQTDPKTRSKETMHTHTKLIDDPNAAVHNHLQARTFLDKHNYASKGDALSAAAGLTFPSRRCQSSDYPNDGQINKIHGRESDTVCRKKTETYL